ncbi:MAG: hypothetical protein K2P86_13725 [Xanthobacteraceae bacterium]|nr:hypothetical protein [Xanthobacteraceae bacterium]
MRRNSRQSLHMQGWAAVVLVGLLAGCSTIENVVGPIGNMGVGDLFKQGPAAADPDNPNANPNAQVSADDDCPSAAIRQGAGAWAQNAGAGPTNVRYQASIVQIARECALLGSTMTIKVGVEGRLVVGPKGGPGSVTVPLRIALVQEGPQPRPIVSKFYGVQVNVTQGSTQVPFTQVEDDLTFPLPADKNLDKYVIYVGFDPQGALPPAKAKAKAPVKKAAPKKQAAPTEQQNQFQQAPQKQQPTFQAPQQQQQQPSNVPTFDPPPRQ